MSAAPEHASAPLEFGVAEPGATYRLRPGGYAVVRGTGDEIAVVATASGLFLPGGGQEDGETPEQAAVREAREECGLILRLVAPLGVADELVHAAAERAHFRKRCAFFAAEVLGRKPSREAGHDLVWLDEDDALVRLAHASQRWALVQHRRARLASTVSEAAHDRVGPRPDLRPRPRPLAVGVCRDGGRILVEHGFDRAEGRPFYRAIGGGIELGERAEDALRREWREELGLELDDVRRIGVLENLFTYEGRAGHEIVFVFAARTRIDPAATAPREHVDSDGARHVVEWVALDALETGALPLYPAGLLELVRSRETAT